MSVWTVHPMNRRHGWLPESWADFLISLMDCKECNHERFRADKLIEDYCAKKGIEI